MLEISGAMLDCRGGSKTGLLEISGTVLDFRGCQKKVCWKLAVPCWKLAVRCRVVLPICAGATMIQSEIYHNLARI